MLQNGVIDDRRLGVGQLVKTNVSRMQSTAAIHAEYAKHVDVHIFFSFVEHTHMIIYYIFFVKVTLSDQFAMNAPAL